jgi:hypothetical protein
MRSSSSCSALREQEPTRPANRPGADRSMQVIVTGAVMRHRPRHLATSTAGGVGPGHARPRVGRPRALSLAGLLLLIAVAASASNPPSPALAAPTSASDCLARGGHTTVSGTLRQPYRADRTPDDHTYDLRRATSVAYGSSTNYPVLLGKGRAGTNLCVLGGHVIGQQSRNLSYQAVYSRYNGDGLWVQGHGTAPSGRRPAPAGWSTTATPPAGPPPRRSRPPARRAPPPRPPGRTAAAQRPPRTPKDPRRALPGVDRRPDQACTTQIT